jgi:hypothetical protein
MKKLKKKSNRKKKKKMIKKKKRGKKKLKTKKKKKKKTKKKKKKKHFAAFSVRILASVFLKMRQGDKRVGRAGKPQGKTESVRCRQRRQIGRKREKERER